MTKKVPWYFSNTAWGIVPPLYFFVTKKYHGYFSKITKYTHPPFGYFQACVPSNEVRLLLYSSSAKEGLRVLSPSSDALGVHTKRCCYQAGRVWGNSISQTESSSPTEWTGNQTILPTNLLWSTPATLGSNLTICKRTTGSVQAQDNV